METATVLALIAVLAAALAILPGTLGIAKLTHRVSSTATGARLIFGLGPWVAVASGLLIVAAGIQAIRHGTDSPAFGFLLLVYAGILVFGFLMHIGLNFRPIKEPTFISAAEALDRFGADEEVIGVIDKSGRSFAFITRLARRPHVVYQPEGDEPFVMSHCILAHSSMAFDMRDGFANPDILVTSVIANNMVFYEKANACSIVQIEHNSREGDLPLHPLSTVAVRLQTWTTLYPDSCVWIRPRTWRDAFYLKLLSRADVIDPASPVMIYPTQNEVDRRLPLKSQVLGVEINDDSCAYPVETVAGLRVLQDEVGGQPIVIFTACGGDFQQVYNRDLQSEGVLDFDIDSATDEIVDKQTGSTWDPTGRCTAGRLAGRRLLPRPHYNKIFWYVWADFYSNTRIYDG